MKRFIISFVLLCTALISTDAQILRTEELEKYAKEKYGEKWETAAANLGKGLTLDKNNSLTYTQIVECQGKTKEQLYVILNYWVTATFNDANSAIKLNDKENGCIIVGGYVGNAAYHMGGMSTYSISLRPIIKIDIKDYKIRITYTLQGYEVLQTVGAGAFSVMSGSNYRASFSLTWTIDECYPFAEKDRHKKASSKALVMAHAYSNVIMDKIEETVKNGLVGNETDNW